MVVSKDGDSHRLAVLRGAPPKFIWIRLGNCRTGEVAQLLRRHREDIARFDQHDVLRCWNSVEWQKRPNKAMEPAAFSIVVTKLAACRRG